MLFRSYYARFGINWGFFVTYAGNDYPLVGMNLRANGSGGYQYDTTDYVSAIRFAGIVQVWTAPSGTAGNTISFTAGPYVSNGGTAWTNASDRRLKNNFTEFTNVLDSIKNLRAGRYEWSGQGQTSQGRASIGLIAQEVVACFPEIEIGRAHV